MGGESLSGETPTRAAGVSLMGEETEARWVQAYVCINECSLFADQRSEGAIVGQLVRGRLVGQFVRRGRRRIPSTR